MPPVSPWEKASPGRTPPDAPEQNPTSQSGSESAQAPDVWPPAASPETTASPAEPSDDLATEFVGRRSRLFWLALKTGALSALTLGIYRFWMKTRLRRWYWSSIRPGGHPLEYVGDPIEKLLGFCIAVVILAFYIGVVNLLLMFVSFSLFEGAGIAYLLSFIGVIPLWFYATYRARRYVLGRTRWRGVRFGLEPGAWGYCWRALLHWGLTIVSLGALWPRMTFYLEKYITDRTFFGSAKLIQGGRWTTLYRAAIPALIAAAFLLLGGIWTLFLDPIVVGSDESIFTRIEEVISREDWHLLNGASRLWLLPIALIGLGYGVIHYRVVSRRILANHKTANGVGLLSRQRPTRISGVYLLGNVLAYFLLFAGIVAAVFILIFTIGLDTFLGADLGEGSLVTSLPRWLGLMLVALIYFSTFLMWSVLSHVLVTYPIMKHQATTLTILSTSGLAEVSQRARDEFAEAEGFAEALDLGAAI